MPSYLNPKLAPFYIAVSIAIILLLEFSTPPEFIFGYLYVIPILLANWSLDKRSTAFVAALGITFTLANLWFPHPVNLSSTVVVDRLITVAALLTAAYLGAKYRQAQEESASQKAVLQAQEESAKLQEDFIATLTHDLKTPLLGASETFKYFTQGQFGPITTEQQSVLAILQTSTAQQLAMVNSLLAIYRNDMSGLTLHQQVLDFDQLCATQIMVLQDLALSREITLHYEGLDQALVYADSLQLSRVVANLVSNAINHTPRNGEVVIHLLDSGSEYQLLVADTGSGIPHTDMKRIFERFYQAEGNRYAVGSGLGLYLARQIVDAHGGRIWAENRSRGCTFGVGLPKAVPHSAVVPKRSLQV